MPADRAEVAQSPHGEQSIWTRCLYMILFAFAYYVVEFVAWTVVIVQFVVRVVTSRLNPTLHSFSADLSAYIHEIWRFLTFNQERLPWPFSDWPKAAAEGIKET